MFLLPAQLSLSRNILLRDASISLCLARNSRPLIIAKVCDLLSFSFFLLLPPPPSLSLSHIFCTQKNYRTGIRENLSFDEENAAANPLLQMTRQRKINLAGIWIEKGI